MHDRSLKCIPYLAGTDCRLFILISGYYYEIQCQHSASMYKLIGQWDTFINLEIDFSRTLSCYLQLCNSDVRPQFGHLPALSFLSGRHFNCLLSYQNIFVTLNSSTLARGWGYETPTEITVS